MSRGEPAEVETARLDRELVRRGLARSRSHARELIRDGSVCVDGMLASKASTSVPTKAAVTVQSGRSHWVGRGAVKLAAGLQRFCAAGLVVRQRRCLDVGASTGGFTQVLLAEGAQHVVALDVGHGQLDAGLAGDVRVEPRPGLNIKDVRPGQLGEPFDLLVVDLSFISLRSVLPGLAALLDRDGDVVLLVKPQFEVGLGLLGKRGVVRSARERHDAVRGVCRVADQVGLGTLDVMPSPLRGTKGNQEYLVWVTPREAGRLAPADLERRIVQMEQP